MCMFADYYFEREKINTVKKDNYFFTWKLTDDRSELHVIDMYIKPEARGGAAIVQLLDDVASIASKEGTSFIVSKVVIGSVNPEVSLQVMLKIGCKLLKAENNKIWLAVPTRERAF